MYLKLTLLLATLAPLAGCAMDLEAPMELQAVEQQLAVEDRRCVGCHEGRPGPGANSGVRAQLNDDDCAHAILIEEAAAGLPQAESLGPCGSSCHTGGMIPQQDDILGKAGF